jgi:penicillin-binding protein 1C
MHAASWFVLPPVQEWYYRKKNPYYKPIPPFSDDCGNEKLRNMAVVYPKNNTRILVPRELNGTVGKTVFEIVHRIPQSRVYWHLNNQYLGETHNSHQMEMAPGKGNYIMTLVDERGESISWGFEVL